MHYLDHLVISSGQNPPLISLETPGGVEIGKIKTKPVSKFASTCDHITTLGEIALIRSCVSHALIYIGHVLNIQEKKRTLH